MRAARQSLATRHHLSTLDASILETLAGGRNPGVGDIAAELHISQPTASDALATLERRGLVVRRRDPADRRRTLISLSRSGAEIAADITAGFAPLLSTGADSAEDGRSGASGSCPRVGAPGPCSPSAGGELAVWPTGNRVSDVMLADS